MLLYARDKITFTCSDMFLATSGTVNPSLSKCFTSAKVSDKSEVKFTLYLRIVLFLVLLFSSSVLSISRSVL
jgi:hypothetical protein